MTGAVLPDSSERIDRGEEWVFFRVRVDAADVVYAGDLLFSLASLPTVA